MNSNSFITIFLCAVAFAFSAKVNASDVSSANANRAPAMAPQAGEVAANQTADEEGEDVTLHELGTTIAIGSDMSLKETVENFMEPEDAKSVLGFLSKEGVNADEVTLDYAPMNGSEINVNGNTVKITNDFGVNIGGQVVKYQPGQTGAEYWKALYAQALTLKTKTAGKSAMNSSLRYLMPEAMAAATFADSWNDMYGGAAGLVTGVWDSVKGVFTVGKGAIEAVGAVDKATSTGGTAVVAGAAALATKAYVATSSKVKSGYEAAKAWLHKLTSPDGKIGRDLAVVSCSAKGEYILTARHKNKKGEAAKKSIRMTPTWLAHHYKDVASAKDNKKCTPDLAKKYEEAVHKSIAKRHKPAAAHGTAKPTNTSK